MTVLEALSHLPKMNEGVFFPIYKGNPCVQGMGQNHRDRDKHCTVMWENNACFPGHKKPMARYLVRLGTYTNLSWAWSIRI